MNRRPKTTKINLGLNHLSVCQAYYFSRLNKLHIVPRPFFLFTQIYCFKVVFLDLAYLKRINKQLNKLDSLAYLIVHLLSLLSSQSSLDCQHSSS